MITLAAHTLVVHGLQQARVDTRRVPPAVGTVRLGTANVRQACLRDALAAAPLAPTALPTTGRRGSGLE